MDRKTKTNILLGGLLIAAIFIITGLSFALWQVTLQQESVNTLTSGCFNVEFTDENPISLGSAYPITDTEGSTLIPYTFTITNTCNSVVAYQVNLEVLDSGPDGLLRVDYVKAKLNDNTPILLITEHQVVKTLENARDAYGMEIGSLGPNETKSFSLRLWLDENTPASEEVMDKILESKITITLVHEKNMYAENSLNGADPVIGEGLIPVKIEDDGTVKRADPESEWYNYKDKRWANAIILKDESISYEKNEVIPEENIESYFVWIPRYRYKIFNAAEYTSAPTTSLSDVQNNADTIEVEFESKYISPSNGTKNDEWLTHPAFTSFNSNGFWVGKFETSKSDSAPDNSNSPMSVQIKPNETSWRNIQVSNAFYTTYDYKRNLDSHMMKNTEWGAVAYLQHSKYGSQESVRFNNTSDYKTGYASVNEPTCGYTGTNSDCNKYGNSSETTITRAYNTEIGYKASTTGNISGIYDMSGGSFEYMMAVMADTNGNPLSGRNEGNNSGFIGGYGDDGTSWPEEKYYDKYAYGTSYSEYTRRLLGDATGEMGPFYSVTYGSQSGRQISSWYADHAHFVNPTYPWFRRGCAYHDGSEAGIFAFSHYYGSTHEDGSFRIVLAP